MTAFAASERPTPRGALSCEIRAVNHRYFELGVRLPDELRGLEPMVRERVGRRVARGKLELVVRLRPMPGESARLRVDDARLESIAAVANGIQPRFPGFVVELTELLRFPGVLLEAGDDMDVAGEALPALLDDVLDAFVTAREREGAQLAAAIGQRLDAIADQLGQLRQWLPAIREGLQAKLQARIAGLPEPLESGRFEQELVLWLQKADIDEEMDRLDSHVTEARRVLALPEAVGRRLDFLLQEFNRESNTLAAKSVDARASRAAVELKVLVEQIREQVQNIE